MTARAAGADAGLPSRLVLAALALLATLILVRMPQIAIAGRFWAEEGTVFFAHAWTMQPWQAIWAPYGGYLNLIANSAPVAARWLLPLPFAPYLTIATGLLFQLMPPLLLLTASDAWLRPWPARAAAVLLLATLPCSEEIWLQTLHCQFELALCCGIILALDTIGGRVGWLRLGLLGLAPLCGPVAIALTPLFFLRAALERSRPRLLQAFVLFAGGAVQVLAFMTHQHGRAYALHPVITLCIVTLRHLAVPLLGIGQAEQVSAALHRQFAASHFPILGALIPLLVLVPLAVAALWRGLRHPGVWLFAGFALTAGASYFGAIGGGLSLLEVHLGQRYVVVPQSLLELCVVSLAATGDLRAALLPRIMVAWLLAVAVLNYWHTAPIVNHGPSWRAEVAAWRADPSHVLVLWPPTWSLTLAR